MNARPYGLAPVAFHLRHIARSLDRLLTLLEPAIILALSGIIAYIITSLMGAIISINDLAL